ncbi:MAG TPA: tetratricopeptide repeat protein [Thermoanaerobaculia bacterium]|nr:tetratricopeptide repeat protein [Thermoanaerobaculia bacterium]
MKKLAVLPVLLLLAAPLGAQTPPAQQPPAAAPTSGTDAAVQEALKLTQAGDVGGAIQKLETLRKSPPVNPRVLSLLGALYLQADKPQEALAVLKPLADAEDADPAVLYNAGRAALLVEQVGLGREYLKRSISKEPASPAARDLGILLSRQGRGVEAYSMLRPWALRNPADIDARLLAASLAVQLERPDDAEQLLQGMPEDDPALQLLRGRIRVLRGDGPGALELLKPVLANHPASVDLEVRRAAAEAYLLAGQPAEAIKLLEGKTGGVPSLVLLTARAQRQAGDAQAAMATLQPLADKLPEDPNTVPDPRPAAGIAMEYGSLLAASGRTAEAVGFYEKATRFHPQSRDAWTGLAQALTASGRKDEAQQAAARAEELAKAAAAPRPARPSTPALEEPAAPGQVAPSGAAAAPTAPALSANLQEAVRLMSEGQNDAALAAVQREIEASPSDLQARALQVRLLLVLQRSPEALQAAEAALALQPENADLVYQRGAVQMATRNLAAAEADLRRALQLAPRHTAAMNDLAVLLISQKKTDEARKLLEEVLRLNPQDRTAAANLEQIKKGGA